MIGIIDFQINNVGSLLNAVKSLGIDFKVVTKPVDLVDCRLIILPGVGTFDAGMNALTALGFDKAIKEIDPKCQKVLGICLGMQLLFDSSDEGLQSGLGFFDQRVRSLRDLGCQGKIPHVGFNDLSNCDEGSIFSKYKGQDFYFIHSFGVPAGGLSVPQCCVNVGGENIVAAIQADNIFATQFHPEKSGQLGVNLIKDIYLC